MKLTTGSNLLDWSIIAVVGALAFYGFKHPREQREPRPPQTIVYQGKPARVVDTIIIDADTKMHLIAIPDPLMPEERLLDTVCIAVVKREAVGVACPPSFNPTNRST